MNIETGGALAEDRETPRLTDIIAVRPSRDPTCQPIPNPGTVFTRTLETIDDDRMAWFLGVLPPA